MLDVYLSDTGWYVIASYDARDGRYYAPMTPEGKRLTGCHTVTGSLEYVALGGTTYRYRLKSSARRALKRIRGEM